MKCNKYYDLLVLLLTIFVSNSRRIKNGKKDGELIHQEPISEEVINKNYNPVFQFIYGFNKALDLDKKVSGKMINAAFKKSNSMTAVGEKEVTIDTLVTLFKGKKHLLRELSYSLKPDLDFPCTLKDKIIDFLILKRGERWDIKDLQRYLKPAIASIADSITKGEDSSIGSAVVDGKKWVGVDPNSIKKHIRIKINKVFIPVYENYNKLSDTFINFYLKTPLMIQLYMFVKDNLNKKEVKPINPALNKFMNYIQKMNTEKGFIKFSLNNICSKKSFKDGISYLLNGLNEKDKLSKVKYKDYGIMIGNTFSK